MGKMRNIDSYMKKELKKVFRAIDTDANGFIDPAELQVRGPVGLAPSKSAYAHMPGGYASH